MKAFKARARPLAEATRGTAAAFKLDLRGPAAADRCVQRYTTFANCHVCLLVSYAASAIPEPVTTGAPHEFSVLENSRDSAVSIEVSTSRLSSSNRA